MSGHVHSFSSLWGHWGEYGNQDEHVHWSECGEAVVVGPGRSCDTTLPHEQRRWSERLTRWTKGKPFRIAASSSAAGER